MQATAPPPRRDPLLYLLIVAAVALFTALCYHAHDTDFDAGWNAAIRYHQ